MPSSAKPNVNVRMTEAMIARADTLLTHVAKVPELATVARPTVADVVRICVLRGLAELEAEPLFPARWRGGQG